MKLALHNAKKALDRFEIVGSSEALWFFAAEMHGFIKEVTAAGAPNWIIGECAAYYTDYETETDMEECRKTVADFFALKLPDILEVLEEMSK